MYLQCCLTLSSFWDWNLSAVTILWDYYSKNLVSKSIYKNTELHVDHLQFLAINYDSPLAKHDFYTSEKLTSR